MDAYRRFFALAMLFFRPGCPDAGFLSTRDLSIRPKHLGYIPLAPSGRCVLVYALPLFYALLPMVAASTESFGYSVRGT